MHVHVLVCIETDTVTRSFIVGLYKSLRCVLLCIPQVYPVCINYSVETP